ncbi:hypothetical protein E8E12_002233 [Didymella heteroderae]|uniref:Uncharacterized protein n=1 Tax=Didymella heteroderae TaxID=1769908 RepID=A0A9P4WHG1_9PLEO|nr:hypothetical protein E8E12_002233 [Didymella heteroderae]
MSHPQSHASPTPTKHRNGFIRALSNISKPVGEWGVSDIPVLSTSVTPRRERASANRSRRDSTSSRSTTSLPRRPDSVDVFVSPSRVSPIRRLSIATVSTFGGWMSEGWMSERVDEDKAEDDLNSQNTGTSTGEPSEITSRQRARTASPVRHKFTIPQSPSVSLTDSFRRGPDASIHPLRMHPPSPSPSLSARANASQALSMPSLSRSPSKIPLSLTPNFDDSASKTSQETISTRRSRRTLSELNIEAANSNFKPHDEELDNNDEEQNRVEQANALLPYKHGSSSRDVGYVEAMRLWYEEKENEASDTRQRERKAARRAGTAGCALASVDANQRL